MGILAQILDKRPKSQSRPQILTASLETCEPAPLPDDTPFKICPCGSSIFWLSVYLDGIFRCAVCEPPPSDRLVKGWLIDGMQLRTFLAERRLQTSLDDHNAEDHEF